MKRRVQHKDKELESAARAVYLISASITYALNELLKTKSKREQRDQLKRLDDERKCLKLNLLLLRREVERGN